MTGLSGRAHSRRVIAPRMRETSRMHFTESGPYSRRAGILLHPTSLPGPGPNGTLGESAIAFIDFLRAAKQSVWQILPLSPPDSGASPYASRSAFAGGHHLVDAEAAHDGNGTSYEEFRELAAFWLDDWALFEAIRARTHLAPWWKWPAELRSREKGALARVQAELREPIEQERQAQWRFWQQWQRIHARARDHGIDILGDIPIFVDHNSADAWAHQEMFKLAEDGEPRVIAGVPPDMFSETGQRWGNPLFDWDAMAASGYRWWVERMRWALRMFDVVRIDHFRGFAAAWEIPAISPTAIEGEWVAGPGKKLFDALTVALGTIPMVAEDLGIITDDVTELRHLLDVPGMAVLQFAFGGDAANPYLPHNIAPDSVVYTGTHDNDTTAGWLESLDGSTRHHLRRYTGHDVDVRELCRMAHASVAHTAILPFQDVLGLGADARMNLPGTSTGNWTWRFTWDQVNEEHAAWLADMTELYGRAGTEEGRR